MTLIDHLAVLGRRWVTVLVVLLVCAGASLAASLRQDPTYSSTAEVYVSTQVSTASVSELTQGSNFSRQAVVTYAAIATTPMVLDAAAADLRAAGIETSLSRQVSVSTATDTTLIDITAVGPTADHAAAIANAVASAFTEVVERLEQPRDGSPSPVRATIVGQAVPPKSASSPKHTTDLALGILVGLGAGVGCALLRERLDVAIRDERKLRRVVSAPLLGQTALDSRKADAALVVRQEPRSPQAESYRQLRTNLQFVLAAGKAKSLVVTSSVPGEGKTTTSINLVLAMADAGARVLLIDADLRRPSVAPLMGLEPLAGLTDILVGRSSAAEVVQPWGDDGRVDVLASGPVPPNPSELLASDAMQQLVDTATGNYDLVVVDAPPLLPVTDAAVLSSVLDGTLLVVGAKRVREHQVHRSLSALEGVQAKLLGVVFNFQPLRKLESYAAYSSEVSSSRNGTRPARSGARGKERARV